MIQPFYGEFLVQPFPLVLGMNSCTHKCAYCFANLTRPNRKACAKSISDQIMQIGQSDTLVSRLLEQGFPVVMCNNSDPFASGNRHLTPAILKLLNKKNVRVAIQTKGGKGIDDALRLIEPSYWYVSIPFLSDSLSKLIEPGAPLVSDRWNLVEKLISKGHSVHGQV